MFAGVRCACGAREEGCVVRGDFGGAAGGGGGLFEVCCRDARISVWVQEVFWRAICVVRRTGAVEFEVFLQVGVA